MKKTLLSIILTICFVIPCTFSLTACTKDGGSDGEVVYTVSEAEWEVNFNITKSKNSTLSAINAGAKTQTFANTFTTLDEITSYTLVAEGIAYGKPGRGILKVAPNAMYIEFYVNGELKEDETGVTPSSDPFYIGMTMMLKSYFPFSGKYNDFTFDETKNAYVASNLVSTVIDEQDITKTYDLFNKKAEITFINGYLNTITVEMCEDGTFEDVYLSLVFTFSDINSTTVELN